MDNYEEKYNFIIKEIAAIREIIGEKDPEYLDEHLAEMVSCPLACTMLIRQWIKKC